MDEGTDGSGTFHGIGQPNVEGEHGTLTGTTNKHQAKSHGDVFGCLSINAEHSAEVAHSHERTALNVAEVERAGKIAVDENTDEEEHIGKTGHDESLL